MSLSVGRVGYKGMLRMLGAAAAKELPGAAKALYSSYTNRRATSGYPSRIGRRRKGTSFRKQMYASEQAKHYPLENSVVLKHNEVWTNSSTQGLVQGYTGSTRIGDQVYLGVFKMRGLFTTPAAASNAYKYRIIIGWSGEELATANVATQFVAGYAASSLMQPSTSTLLATNGIVNGKAFTVLYDQTIDINSVLAGTADWQSFDVSVPLSQVFNYKSAASVYGKTKNLYAMVIAVANGGTNGVTSCGSCVVSTDLVFK